MSQDWRAFISCIYDSTCLCWHSGGKAENRCLLVWNYVIYILTVLCKLLVVCQIFSYAFWREHLPEVVSLLYDVISALSVACSRDNGVGLRWTQALFWVYANIMWAVPQNKTLCMNAVPDLSVWGSFEGLECRRGLVQQQNGSTSSQLQW